MSKTLTGSDTTSSTTIFLNVGFWTISVLEPSKEEDKKEEEVNPLLYNYTLSFGWRDISLDKHTNVENSIKDAHFALVLDYDKVKNGDFKKVSQINSEREVIKSGSKLTVTDEMVRKENIQRYMNKIAERSDLISDISNVKAVASRIHAMLRRWCSYR